MSSGTNPGFLKRVFKRKELSLMKQLITTLIILLIATASKADPGPADGPWINLSPGWNIITLDDDWFYRNSSEILDALPIEVMAVLKNGRWQLDTGFTPFPLSGGVNHAVMVYSMSSFNGHLNAHWNTGTKIKQIGGLGSDQFVLMANEGRYINKIIGRPDLPTPPTSTVTITIGGRSYASTPFDGRGWKIEPPILIPLKERLKIKGTTGIAVSGALIGNVGNTNWFATPRVAEPYDQLAYSVN